MKKYKLIKVSVLSIMLLASSTALQSEETPMSVIQKSNEKVSSILKESGKLNVEKEKRIMAILNSMTDFPAIAGKVAEKFSKKLTPVQMKTFRSTFQELLEVSSLKKAGRYRADRFEYGKEEITENKAKVETTAFYKDDNLSLVYQMEKSKKGWFVVNYIVDDVNTVRNYKKQFNRLFRKKTFEAVIEQLKRQIAKHRKDS